MQLRGNRPIAPSVVAAPATTGPIDIADNIKTALVDPVFAATMGAAPVTAFDDAGNPTTEEAIAELIGMTFSDTVNIAAEDEIKSFFQQAWTHFDATSALLAKESFLNAAARKAKLPDATPTIIYTARDDVIPAAKGQLARSECPEHWTASLGFFARGLSASDVLVFSFESKSIFDQFKAFFATRIAAWPNLPQNQALFHDLQKIKLDSVVEALWLRKTIDDPAANADNSFARVLIRSLFDFVAQTNDPYLVNALPWSIPEMIHPTAVVFANVEVHAKSKPSVIADEWKLIATARNMPVHMVSNTKLSRMTSAARQQAKAATAAARKDNQPAERAAEVPFAGSRPPVKQFIARIDKLLAKMGQITSSKNTMKNRHRSYNVPSRRKPDDIDAAGMSVKTIYRPDLHLYIDTSGSISEENYKDAILSAIAIARKLNVNLFFNSFSHILSDCTYLPVQGRSVRQIYNQFRRTPKVTGGTDYAQIWQYINMSKQRRAELSIIITDFEYGAPSQYIEHPQNLYYMPCSAMDWDWMVRDAKHFVNSARHIDPNLRKHILM